MDHIEVHRLVDAVVSVTADSDRDHVTGALGDLARLTRWCQGQQVRLARMLAGLDSFPERALAEAANVELGAATNVLGRVHLNDKAPLLAEALTDGAVSGEHLDVLGRALRHIEPEHRSDLAVRADNLVAFAAMSTPEQFARRLRLEVRRLEADDGTSRLERQRRATFLRSRIDPVTGMWKFWGEFDPVNGMQLGNRLDNAMSALFSEFTPPSCPSDPVAKNDHLRALALLALTDDIAGSGGRPDVTVVVDARSEGGLVVDWGFPIEVPFHVLRDLADDGDVHAVVVRNGIVLHAPGLMNLGRSTRIASKAQRRVLRALYPVCAIPGCATRFALCKVHHVRWWRIGGYTDLDNLLPVCTRHHHAIHDDGWALELDPDRTLTISQPDGCTMTTGPPQRYAA